MRPLSEEESAIMLRAAAPIARTQRAAFFAQVAQALSTAGELGPGTVHRVCRAVQREFFDPPHFDGTPAKYG
jgi:hypothetical protein